MFHPAGLFFIFVVTFFVSGCSAPRQAETLYSAPALLPYTTPAMRTAGYWISRHLAPDEVVLSPDDIARLNAHSREEQKLFKDLTRLPEELSGEDLRETLESTARYLRKKGYTRLYGSAVPLSGWDEMAKAAGLNDITPTVRRRHGLITDYSDQRLLPVADGLFAKPYDVDFDELQNSGLDIGTPVSILHSSRDGQWFYVDAALSSGWVRADKIGLVDRDVFMTAARPESFVVVIAPKADIYRDRAMTDFYGAVRMGARLPLAGLVDDGPLRVWLPIRRPDGTAALETGFIPAEQAREGYLPYTPRHIIIQAFKMLHQPYGWGGMYGAQDCSRFLQQVFATVGVEMPRNSGSQIMVGTLLAQWGEGVTAAEKLAFLERHGSGGITVMGMRGHIMLYAGFVEGRAYAIHAAWAYRKPGPKGDEIYVMDSVVVSDLTLGQGSKRGSLLDRLNAVRRIGYGHGR